MRSFERLQITDLNIPPVMHADHSRFDIIGKPRDEIPIKSISDKTEHLRPRICGRFGPKDGDEIFDRECDLVFTALVEMAQGRDYGIRQYELVKYMHASYNLVQKRLVVLHQRKKIMRLRINDHCYSVYPTALYHKGIRAAKSKDPSRWYRGVKVGKFQLQIIGFLKSRPGGVTGEHLFAEVGDHVKQRSALAKLLQKALVYERHGIFRLTDGDL